MSEYGDLEELSNHAASCAALTQAVVAHIRVSRNHVDQAAPELAERGRSLLARLRYHINKWNAVGKHALRDALQANGDAHRNAIQRATSLNLQIHNLSEVHNAANGHDARVYRGIAARWPAMCGGFPAAMLALADQPVVADVRHQLKDELDQAVAPVAARLMTAAQQKYQEVQGDLTVDNINQVVRMAEEAAAVAQRFNGDEEPAFALIAQVYASAG